MLLREAVASSPSLVLQGSRVDLTWKSPDNSDCNTGDAHGPADAASTWPPVSYASVPPSGCWETHETCGHGDGWSGEVFGCEGTASLAVDWSMSDQEAMQRFRAVPLCLEVSEAGDSQAMMLGWCSPGGGEVMSAQLRWRGGGGGAGVTKGNKFPGARHFRPAEHLLRSWAPSPGDAPALQPGAPSDWRMTVARTVKEVLMSGCAEVMDAMEPDGYVPVDSILEANQHLAAKVWQDPLILLRAVHFDRRNILAVDWDRQAVRVLSTKELLCAACEEELASRGQEAGPLPLRLVATMPSVQRVVAREAKLDSRLRAPSTLHSLLREALAESALVEVLSDGKGVDVDIDYDMVTLRSPGLCVVAALMAVLRTEKKARSLLAKEGEVSLPLLLELSAISRALERAGVTGREASLDALREAVRASGGRYSLDIPGMSLRPAAATAEGDAALTDAKGAKASTGLSVPLGLATEMESTTRAMLDREASLAAAKLQTTTVVSHRRFLPLERDIRKLRELLKFYFEFFNLQHNRLLMSIVEAQRRRWNYDGNAHGKNHAGRVAGYLRSGGQRPIFSQRDIENMPRIAVLLEPYPPKARAPVLAAALILPSHGSDDIPLRIRRKHKVGPCGAWAAEEVAMELNYIPELRFVETRGFYPELSVLTEPDAPASIPKVVAPNTLCVVSLSVSSELSHADSPTGLDFSSEEAEGLDQSVLDWPQRQQKIKRQLLAYQPDIIAVQGLQCIDFAERCSEWESGWFNANEEDPGNHLVGLYHVLSKENYGVSFVPATPLPNSSNLCLGNAVFWKRSRWEVEHMWSIPNSAACVHLKSKLNCPDVIVCSSKTAAGYIRDWGDSVDDEELAEMLLPVHRSLVQAASRSGARLLWCGDFSTEPEVILKSIEGQASPTAEPVSLGSGCTASGAVASTPTAWRSACFSVVGREEPWSSASRCTAGRLVDVILHNDGLNPVAVLASTEGRGCEKTNLVQMLRDGFPSDHLMQLAVFVNDRVVPSAASSGVPRKAAGQRPLAAGQGAAPGAVNTATEDRVNVMQAKGKTAAAGAGDAAAGVACWQ